jgi:hypothetical protein
MLHNRWEKINISSIHLQEGSCAAFELITAARLCFFQILIKQFFSIPGIPELSIPSFNPLDVKNIKIAYNEGSPLQTTIQYFKLKWHGFTTATVSKIG